MHRRKKSSIKVFLKTIQIAFKETPKLMFLMLLIGLISAAFQGGITIQTHRMLDAASKVIGNDNFMMRAVIEGAVLCGVVILAQLINGVHNYSYDIFINKMKNKLNRRLNDHLQKVEPILFENSKFLDWIDKSRVGMNSSIDVILILLDIFTYYVPYFIFMGIYLHRVDPSFMVMLCLIFIPVMISQAIRMKIFSKLEDESSVLRRKMKHYEECVSDIRYLKETRILGAVGFFKNKFMDVLNRYNSNIKKSSVKANNFEIVLDIITLAGYIGVIGMLFKALISGKISVAAFGAIYASISTMFNMMEEILRYNIGNISEQLGSVKNFVELLDMEKTRIAKEEDFSGEIRIEGVSFRYPESDFDVLKNINIVIKPKETIALVGANGSGKSTFANLLLGIYEPTEGDIYVGKNKREKNSFNFKNKSALFQKFQKYKLSLEDNINLSQFNKVKGLHEVAEKANIKDLYDKEKNTVLSVEFDGIDLSLGQWQRVSLARALHRECDFIVLDEPTASIDALEEDMMYRRFEDISKDKTTVIVTHHLGSVSFADRIMVMDQGEIVEVGTHSELIEKNGLYNKMFTTQQKSYV